MSGPKLFEPLTVGNLTNKRYLIDAGNTGGGFGIPTYIAGEPRFYGVELGAKF